MNDWDDVPTGIPDPEWPHGCRCGVCGKVITEDFKMGLKEPTREDDVPVYLVVCVECWTTNRDTP